ncbi:MAG: vitamin B12-dependent ribonucleotide reductase, partial [Actinomycetota bacterium]
ECKGFATIGEYEDGRPGEVFLTVSKQGSTLAGIMDAFAKSISYGLQYGVPLRAFIEAFINTRFEPAGMTDDAEIRIASSIVDYLFRRLAVEYLTDDERAELGIFTREERMQPTLPGVEESMSETLQGIDLMADPKTIPSVSDLVAQLDFAAQNAAPHGAQTKPARTGQICTSCGSANMQRAGACYVCGDCGTSSGCS